MPAEGAVPAVVTSKEIVTWTLTSLGIGASLLWNWWNSRQTKRMAAEVRTDAFDLDEWKNHRAAMASRLDDFESAGDRLLALTRGDHQANALRDAINSEGREFVAAHEALLRALGRYGGANWESLAYGTVENGESNWDRLNAVLGGVVDHGEDSNAIRASLGPIRDHLRSIAGGITGRILSETAQHRPRTAI